MNPVLAHNLALVDQHIRDEAWDPDAVMALYCEDIVLDPICGMMAEVLLQPLDRFATEERLGDEMLVCFRLTGTGFMNAPLPVGRHVELRLLHHLHIRDGLIAREIVYQGWRRLDTLAD